MKASFRYKKNEDNFFILTSPTIDLNTSIYIDDYITKLKISHFKDLDRDIQLNGNIYFDMQKTELYTSLELNISDEASFKIYTQSNDQTTFYNVKTNKDIKKFKDTIDLAHLSDTIMFWAYRAIDMTSITITSIKGFIDYEDIDNAYKNLHIQSRINGLNYTYNTKLDQIHTEYTELEFKNGNLLIRPKQAYSYGMYLGNSNIKIDFKQENVLLTLKLLFQAKLNKDLLKILHTYKIDLPFYQNSGSVDTDLTLKIGLRDVDIESQGIFKTDNSNFTYLGLDIDLYDAVINLHNYDVSIKNMSAQYKEIAKSFVDVKFNAKNKQGKLNFRVSEVNLNPIQSAVDIKPLCITYNIDPNGDTISIEESTWKFKNRIINIDAVIIPFNLETLLLKIPATYISLENVGNAFVNGTFNLKTMYADLNADVLKFSYDGITLTQTNTPLKILLKESITVRSKNDIYFSVSGSKYIAKSLLVNIDKDNLYLKHTTINIGDYITTKIYAKHNFKNNRTHVSLSNFTLKDPNTLSVLYKKNKILLNIKILENKIKITSKELRGEFISQDSGWKLKINALDTVAKRSDFLTALHIDNGNFILYKNKGNKYTKFKAHLQYPYKILVTNGLPTQKYTIQGKIYKNKVSLIVNNSLNISVKDSIEVSMENTVVNINEIFRFLKETTNENNNSKNFDIILKAKNSNIYVSKERKILYDTLNMQLYNKILTVQMDYKEGHAGMRYKDKQFHLYGKNFNDSFMNKLFSLSKFSEGSLDFSLSGTTNEYTGVLYVNKTTMKNYKILNNILAFVNTVPSLITFSLPGYNTNGLFVKRAYINFKAKNDIFDIHDINLESKEMNIAGKGRVDLNKNDLDILLNLKTDLGSDIAKVPVVGYLLLDKGTLSTTLKMRGKIDNPKIRSMIAEDIVVAPFNIIKRTLSLPYNIITGIKKSKE